MDESCTGATSSVPAPVDTIGGQNINDLPEVIGYLEGLKNNYSTTSHKCPTCQSKVMEALHNMVKHNIFGDRSEHSDPNHFVVGLTCPHCEKDIAVRVCGEWYFIEDMLKSNNFQNCSCQNVNRPIDRLILFLMNQIIYKQYEFTEGDPEFLPVPPQEHARILWSDGKALGFYTIKAKGSVYNQYDWSCYTMNVIDIIYVRKKYRSCGWGSYMLENFISYHLGQSVGIHAPISDNMYKVLHRFLVQHPDLQDYMWETTYTGDEGYRKNIWLHLKRIGYTKNETTCKSDKTADVRESNAEASIDSHRLAVGDHMHMAAD